MVGQRRPLPATDDDLRPLRPLRGLPEQRFVRRDRGSTAGWPRFRAAGNARSVGSAWALRDVLTKQAAAKQKRSSWLRSLTVRTCFVRRRERCGADQLFTQSAEYVRVQITRFSGFCSLLFTVGVIVYLQAGRTSVTTSNFCPAASHRGKGKDRLERGDEGKNERRNAYIKGDWNKDSTDI